MILTIIQKFMRTVNERREDFECNNEKEEESDEESKENLYDFTNPKTQAQAPVKATAQKTPEKSGIPPKSSPLALKNNFMSPKEAEEEENVKHAHPLKSQLIDCFTEMSNSKAKYQIIRPLSYCTTILKDSSINDEECPPYGYSKKVS
jgi:hypothetical protein